MNRRHDEAQALRALIGRMLDSCRPDIVACCEAWIAAKRDLTEIAVVLDCDFVGARINALSRQQFASAIEPNSPQRVRDVAAELLAGPRDCIPAVLIMPDGFGIEVAWIQPISEEAQ